MVVLLGLPLPDPPAIRGLAASAYAPPVPAGLVRLGLPAAVVVRLFVVVVVVYLVVVALVVPVAVGIAVVFVLDGLPLGLPRGLALVLCLIVLPLRLGLAAPLLGLPAVVVYRLVGLLFDAVVDPCVGEPALLAVVVPRRIVNSY